MKTKFFLKNRNSLLLLFGLVALTCLNQLHAQTINEMEGGNIPRPDSLGVLNIYSIGVGAFNQVGLRVENNSYGAGGAPTIYSFGEVGGHRNLVSGFTNFGVLGHKTTSGSSGSGGYFSYGDFDNPSNYVQIAGFGYGLKIVDGTEQDGYVLTSDATGRASWQPPASSSPWEVLSSNTIRYGNSSNKVAINASIDVNSSLYVRTPSGNSGADTAAIYAYRSGGSNDAINAGSSWSVGGVSCALKGYSFYGNKYSAGIAGYSYLDYDNSAAIIGSKQNGSTWGALAYQDTNSKEWGGYINGDFYVNDKLEIQQNLDVKGRSRFQDRVMIDPNGGIPTHNLTIVQDQYTATGGIKLEQAAGPAAGSIWQIYLSQSTSNLDLYFNNVRKGGFDDVTGNYNPASDRRLKNNVQDMPSMLDKIKLLKPKTYSFKSDKTARPCKGFIAQELKEVFPNSVIVNGDDGGEIKDLHTVNYTEMIPVLIKGMQEQQELIEKLQNRISELEEKIKD